MSAFSPALPILLAHEGGFVNDPDDPGGATNFGISLRTLQKVGDLDGDGELDFDIDGDGDVDVDDIRDMPIAKVRQFYKAQFWDRYRYGRIEDQGIATRVLCLSVHAGPKQAHLTLQRALHYHTVIAIDGLIGPLTIAGTSMVEPGRLLTELRHETAAFYRRLVKQHSKLYKYEAGWLNRAYA